MTLHGIDEVHLDEVNWIIKNHPEIAPFVSDGYHTFEELYEHRCQLWVTTCKILQAYSESMGHDETAIWKSKTHSDGTSWDGWFLLGNGYEPGYQITYHLPIKYWDELNSIQTLDKAPEFDGHTSDDVLKLLKLICQ